jgi:glycosyltransferase involved in cell wall biosynthesis
MIISEQESASLPLVSILVATYNGERFLRQQMDSLIGQTYRNLEIVVVDDASSDGTMAILDEYVQSYAHISRYPSEKNGGYIKNFERGILLCKGKYIALCDQDDIWLPEKISRLMELRGDAPLVYSDSALINGNGKTLGMNLSDLKRMTDFWTPLNYVTGGTASGHAMLVKREVILQSLPLPSIVTHDYWIGFAATFFGSLKYVDEPLVLYRQHEANVVGLNVGKEKATKKVSKSKEEKDHIARQRIRLLYEKCPDALTEEKKVFQALDKSYQDFSLVNNCRRMILFFRYRNEITAYKRRGAWRIWFFCFKMFFRLQ